MLRKDNVNNAKMHVDDKTLDKLDMICENFFMSRSSAIELVTAFYYAFVANARQNGKRGFYNARND